jgi:hypothetical protein
MATDRDKDRAANAKTLLSPAAALYGRLRALRCHAQSLRDFAADLQKKAELLADPAARKSELTSAFEQSQDSFENDIHEIDRLLVEILDIIKDNDALYNASGDGITNIQIQWGKAAAYRKKLWKRSSDESGRLLARLIAVLHAIVYHAVVYHKLSNHDSDESGRLLARLIAALDEVVYQCCEITIPDDLTYQLKLMPIGAALNFRDTYSSELPAPAQRRRFLRYLDLYTGFVAGLVDIENERIFRASDKRWRRAISVAGTMAFALIGFGLVALACYFGGSGGQADKWPFTADRLRQHLSAYAFLLLGSVAHVVINLLKQDRVASASPLYLYDWILRIHVRETSYFLSALSLWLGAFAMAFLFPGGAGWKTAFFLGYSYDSFMDLFIKRFEGVVPAVSDLVKQASTTKL